MVTSHGHKALTQVMASSHGHKSHQFSEHKAYVSIQVLVLVQVQVQVHDTFTVTRMIIAIVIIIVIVIRHMSYVISQKSEGRSQKPWSQGMVTRH